LWGADDMCGSSGRMRLMGRVDEAAKNGASSTTEQMA
jgi:hypothetical protein